MCDVLNAYITAPVLFLFRLIFAKYPEGEGTEHLRRIVLVLVHMGGPQANTPQVFDDAVFDTDLDGGLDAEPPTLETPAQMPPTGMAARNVRVRKPPEKFIPSMQGNKYEIALAQITASFGKSKNALAFAQMSVKLMSKGEHRRADLVGMVMAQVSLKAALKTWGTEAEEAIGKEMKQLHWRNSFKPILPSGLDLPTPLSPIT